MMQLVSQREDLSLQGITGPKTGRDQSEKGDEKRAHRGSHHHLTNNRNPCVFRSDGVFGNHRVLSRYECLRYSTQFAAGYTTLSSCWHWLRVSGLSWCSRANSAPPTPCIGCRLRTPGGRLSPRYFPTSFPSLAFTASGVACTAGTESGSRCSCYRPTYWAPAWSSFPSSRTMRARTQRCAASWSATARMSWSQY